MASAFQDNAFQNSAFQVTIAVIGYPAEGDVRFGIQYGPTGTEFTGSLVVPDVNAVVADIMAALAAQATKANIVEVNTVRVTGTGTTGDTWGPTTGSFGTTYNPTEAITTALLAALNATSIPVDVVKVNSTVVQGTGADGDTWGPA